MAAKAAGYRSASGQKSDAIKATLDQGLTPPAVARRIGIDPSAGYRLQTCMPICRYQTPVHCKHSTAPDDAPLKSSPGSASWPASLRLLLPVSAYPRAADAALTPGAVGQVAPLTGSPEAHPAPGAKR